MSSSSSWRRILLSLNRLVQWVLSDLGIQFSVRAPTLNHQGSEPDPSMAHRQEMVFTSSPPCCQHLLIPKFAPHWCQFRAHSSLRPWWFPCLLGPHQLTGLSALSPHLCCCTDSNQFQTQLTLKVMQAVTPHTITLVLFLCHSDLCYFPTCSPTQLMLGCTESWWWSYTAVTAQAVALVFYLQSSFCSGLHKFPTGFPLDSCLWQHHTCSFSLVQQLSSGQQLQNLTEQIFCF